MDVDDLLDDSDGVRGGTVDLTQASQGSDSGTPRAQLFDLGHHIEEVEYKVEITNGDLTTEVLKLFSVDGVADMSLIKYLAVHMQIALTVRNPWVASMNASAERWTELWKELEVSVGTEDWKESQPCVFPFALDKHSAASMLRSHFSHPLTLLHNHKDLQEFTQSVFSYITKAWTWAIGRARAKFPKKVDRVPVDRVQPLHLFGLAFHGRQPTKCYIQSNQGRTSFLLTKRGIVGFTRWFHLHLAFASSISTYIRFDSLVLSRQIFGKSDNSRTLSALEPGDLDDCLPKRHSSDERNAAAWRACAETLLANCKEDEMRVGDALNIEFATLRMLSSWFRHFMLKNMDYIVEVDEQTLRLLTNQTAFHEFARAAVFSGVMLQSFVSEDRVESEIPEKLSQCLFGMALSKSVGWVKTLNEGWRRIASYSSSCAWHFGRHIANRMVRDWMMRNGVVVSGFFRFWDFETGTLHALKRKCNVYIHVDPREFIHNYYDSVVRQCAWSHSRTSGVQYPMIQPDQEQVRRAQVATQALDIPWSPGDFDSASTTLSSLESFRAYFDLYGDMDSVDSDSFSVFLKRINTFFINSKSRADIANSAPRVLAMPPLESETPAVQSGPESARRLPSVLINDTSSSTFWYSGSGDSWYNGRISVDQLWTELKSFVFDDSKKHFQQMEALCVREDTSQENWANWMRSIEQSMRDKGDLPWVVDRLLVYIDANLENAPLRQTIWNHFYPRMRSEVCDSKLSSEAAVKQSEVITVISRSDWLLNRVRSNELTLSEAEHGDDWLCRVMGTFQSWQAVLLNERLNGGSLKSAMLTEQFRNTMDFCFDTSLVSRKLLDDCSAQLAYCSRIGTECAASICLLSRALGRCQCTAKLLYGWFVRLKVGNAQKKAEWAEGQFTVSEVLALFDDPCLNAFMTQVSQDEALQRQCQRRFGELLFELGYCSREELVHCLTLQGCRSVNIEHPMYILIHSIARLMLMSEHVRSRLPTEDLFSQSAAEEMDELQHASLGLGRVKMTTLWSVWNTLDKDKVLSEEQFKLVVRVCMYCCLAPGNLLSTMLRNPLLPRPNPNMTDHLVDFDPKNPDDFTTRGVSGEEQSWTSN